MRYTCGHESNEPRNMGRGAARQRRLAEWFNRPCLACALVIAERHARSLTDARGNPLDYYTVTLKIEDAKQRTTYRYMGL